jgi:hypothetical protein
MTFYNVLSALLFLGSLRVFLLTVEYSNWSGAIAGACLSILVFNDMLSTSHDIESQHQISYSMPLMLIDLLNFQFLALATVILSPSANLFQASFFRIANSLGKSTFWLLLMLYWVFLMLWTHISRRPRGGQSTKRILAQSTVALAFGIEWFLSACGKMEPARIGRLVVLIYLLFYLTVIREYIRKANM